MPVMVKVFSPLTCTRHYQCNGIYFVINFGSLRLNSMNLAWITCLIRKSECNNPIVEFHQS